MLPPLSDEECDCVDSAIAQWENAFLTRGEELSASQLDCPRDLESALIDAINRRRYFLTLFHFIPRVQLANRQVLKNQV